MRMSAFVLNVFPSQHYYFRYPVAIKSPKYNTEKEVYDFLEEVKSMLVIKKYHENIVNLQGITYKKGKPDESLFEVNYATNSLCDVIIVLTF